MALERRAPMHRRHRAGAGVTLAATEARCHGVIDDVLGDFSVLHCCSTCQRFKERKAVMKLTPWLSPPPADEDDGTCESRIPA